MLRPRADFPGRVARFIRVVRDRRCDRITTGIPQVHLHIAVFLVCCTHLHLPRSLISGKQSVEAVRSMYLD